MDIFFKGRYFLVSSDSSGQVSADKYGVVRSSSDIDRTCSIRWFLGNGEELEIEDDVSVYDLTENADMVFNPGDLVIAVSCRNEGDAQEHGVAGQVIGGIFETGLFKA